MRGPIIRREWFTISWGWFTISWDMHQVSVTKGGRGECVHQRGTVVGTRNLACNTSKVLSQSPKRRGQAAEARLTSLRS